VFELSGKTEEGIKQHCCCFGVHSDAEDDESFIKVLNYNSDLVFVIRSLLSGQSSDVYGELTFIPISKEYWMVPERLNIKLSETSIEVFVPGTRN